MPPSSELFQILSVSVAAFVATNIDVFWLLVALYAEHARTTWAVTTGYVAATILVASVAWAASSVLELMPPHLIDYLGIIPIALGLARARALLSPSGRAERGRVSALPGLGSFALTLSLSADNFAVLASLFADARRSLEPAIFLCVAACAVGWSLAAHWLCRRAPLAGPLRQVSRILLPALLFVVGCHLLLDTATNEPH